MIFHPSRRIDIVLNHVKRSTYGGEKILPQRRLAIVIPDGCLKGLRLCLGEDFEIHGVAL